MRTAAALLLSAAAAFAAFVPSTAPAATTIGSTLARPAEESTCGQNSTFVNAQLAPPAVLTAPYDGVVVRWRASLYQPGGAYEYRLRVLQPSTKNDDKYRFIASGPEQLLPAAGLNVLTLPQPLPIKAGDVIAYDCQNNAPAPAAGENSLFPGNSSAYFIPIPADGKVAESSVPSGAAYGEEELINADVVGFPSLTAVSPSKGGARGGSLVTVTGEHLGDLTSATVGGVSTASVSPVSETEATLAVPAHPPGKADVQVTNAAGSSNTLAGAFEYVGPPTISSFTQARPRWKPRAGTKLSFALNEAASAKLSFEAHPPGKKYKCPRGNRGKRCRFYASISLDAQAGTTTVPLHGKVPGTKKRLGPGRYWVTLSATNAFGETSSAKPLAFEVLR